MMEYLRLSQLKNPSEKKDWWISKIKQNLEDMKNGLPWVYYDRHGNVCTKEQARISFSRDNDFVNEAKTLFS